MRQRGKSSRHNRWITAAAVVCTGLIATPLAMNAVEWHSSASAVTRNFFGTIRKTEGQVPAGVYRDMMNGNISHGTQILGEDMRRVPTRYYGFSSGLGIALRRPGFSHVKSLSRVIRQCTRNGRSTRGLQPQDSRSASGLEHDFRFCLGAHGRQPTLLSVTRPAGGGYAMARGRAHFTSLNR